MKKLGVGTAGTRKKWGGQHKCLFGLVVVECGRVSELSATTCYWPVVQALWIFSQFDTDRKLIWKRTHGFFVK